MIGYRLLVFEFFQLSRRNLQQLLRVPEVWSPQGRSLSVSRDRLTDAFALNGVRKLIGPSKRSTHSPEPEEKFHIEVY